MFVKHPTSTDDGTLSLATSEGVKTIPMVHGVIEWPDDLPLHNRFVPCEAPDALLQRLREEEESALHALAKKLGFALKKEVSADDAKAVKAAVAEDTPKKAKR